MLMYEKIGQNHDMTTKESLYRLAESQAGYFTATQAAQAGIGRSTLAYHARTGGRFERVGRGVYRIRQFPSSPHEHVMASWLQFEKSDAVVSHATALELHDLSDVISDAVHLTLPRSARWRNQRKGMRLHFASHPLEPDELQQVFGMPVTSVERSIADYAQDAGQPEQIEIAVAQALARGITTEGRLRDAAEFRSIRVRHLLDRAIEQAR